MKRMAKAVFLKALSAVDPSKILKDRIRIEKDRLLIKTEGNSEKGFDLSGVDKIYLVGTGKATSSMAQAIEEIFDDRITRGVITTKYGHLLPLRKTEIIEAGHPLPDRKGYEGAKKIQRLLKESGPKDLVIFLLSGGGSALLPFPADHIDLREKQEVTQFLLDCGADIKEINTIRKHISRMKGGWLAKWAYPSTVIGFILSDVVGDHLDVIGSGPTVPDPSTFEEAWEILKKYHLLSEIAPSIRRHLQLGKEGKVEETPKPQGVVFERVYNTLLGSNILALLAAKEEATAFGFNTLILSSSIEGETREAARFHTAIAKEVISSGNPIPMPACILSGGETTVTIKGKGLGGRNQEFVLAGASEISGIEKVVFLSGGTDGTDGPTDATGAVADHTTVQRAKSMGLDPNFYLDNNDAYPFFEKLGDLLITGPTHTNVMDVRILLVD
ncbi:MAG: glycerate kinase [Deltaproteobacteria bacterium RBG_16_47_11]|nr:MAG: glycerate kinase [Deltaproteobacteria bacterium RBG_16_47_11]